MTILVTFVNPNIVKNHVFKKSIFRKSSGRRREVSGWQGNGKLWWINMFSTIFHYSPTIPTPPEVRSLTPLGPPFGPLLKGVHKSNVPPWWVQSRSPRTLRIRRDRWGITKNTLFHVYLSLFIIFDASQRPPDDFLKTDFFEKPDFWLYGTP